MAEIRVQRKRPGLLFPIVAALVLVLLVWAAAQMLKEDENGANEATQAVPHVPEPAPTSGSADPPPAAISAFLVFTGASHAATAGPAHDYTATGLRRLSAAMEAIVEQQRVGGREVPELLDAFRRTAREIQEDPAATGHASRVREALIGAATLMAAVQQERWPEADDLRIEVEAVRAAAAALDEQRPLLDQT
ncbi:MAG: hypothetical protein ICV72_12510, partial [Aldersonia sp.]|nr:hypothetical protein [Aldersonia sp.]